MRKNKDGAPAKIELKKLVVKLRNDGFSFSEIAEHLNMKSRVYAYYHYKTARKYGLIT